MQLYIENVENWQGDILSLLKMLGIDTNLNNNYGEGDLEDRSLKSEPGPMTRDQAAQTVLRGELKQLATYFIFLVFRQLT